MVAVTPPRQICHIISSLEDTEQNALVIANIRQFPQPHFEHTLIVLKKSHPLSVVLPHDVSCLELALKGSWLHRMRECHRALTVLRPDICQTYGEHAFPVQWFAHRLNIPLKLHIHHSTRAQSGWALDPIRSVKYRLLSHSVDIVISTEDSDLIWLTEKALLESGKTQLIRSGIDNRYHCPRLREIDSGISNHFVGTVPIPAHHFVVGVPVAGSNKSTVLAFLDEYIAARAQSARFARDCLLLLLGNSPHLHEYRNALERAGINDDSVRICNHSDYDRFYHHIDAIVSLDEKGHTPVSLLEAMSMGLPVIRQRDDDSECIDGDPLLWPTDYDANLMQYQLLTLYDNDHQRMRLGQASRRYVIEKHSHHEYRLRYRALYTRAKKNEVMEPSGTATVLHKQWVTHE